MGTSFSALRRLFARADDPYAGADIELARRFAGVTWPAAILIAYVLVPFFPPTHAFGPAGWYACAAGALVTLAGYPYLPRHPERVTYNFFYVAGWCSLAQLALLQWLAGGRIAPYHEFLLFQIIATGLMHPPRRFPLFIAAVMAAGFAPAFYAPATARVGEIATEQVLWVGLGVVLLLLMRNIRA